MKSTKKVGRPKKTAAEYRGRYLSVPVNQDELDAIQRAAKTAETLTATWCRETLLRAAKRGKS